MSVDAGGGGAKVGTEKIRGFVTFLYGRPPLHALCADLGQLLWPFEPQIVAWSE